MKRLAILFGLLVSFACAYGQDQDCNCLGTWVQILDGSPQNYGMGPTFLHSFQTEACDPLTIGAHTHSKYKLAYCSEGGGSCSTLGWISELQTLFDSSHFIDVPIGPYVIPPGYESREEMSYTKGVRTQSFECQVNGVAQKTLSRSRNIDYDHVITVTYVKIRECIDPDPGG